MRCPKCSYLSYEDVTRCRNCGYDFSLAVPPEAVDAPTLDAPIGSRTWHEHASRDPQDPADQMSAPDETAAVDLPLFDPPETAAPPSTPEPPDAEPARTSRPTEGYRPPEPPPGPRAPAAPAPLDPPPVAIPPAPPPLVVRRTVDVARPSGATGAPSRSAAPRRPATPPEPALDFDLPPAQRDDTPTPAEGVPVIGHGRADDAYAHDDEETRPIDDTSVRSTGIAGARLTAGAVDAGLLIGIDLLVVWLTLRLLGLTPADWTRLPLAPLLGFLGLLDVSYLVTFTAASGQSIGKMLTGVRVVAENGTRVPFGHAVVRSVAVLLCAIPAGLGLLPILLDGEGRGLHDRMAGTRVGPAE